MKEFISQYQYLQEDFSKRQISKILFEMIKITFTSLIMVIAQVSSSLFNSLGFFVMNRTNRNDMQAGLSLYLMMRALFLVSFYYSIASKMAISVSQSFGQNSDMTIGKKFFTQAAIVLCGYSVAVYLPLIIFAEYYMPWLRFSVPLIEEFKVIALKSFTSDILDGARFLLMYYCTSQKIEMEFAIGNWVNIPVSVVVTLVLSFSLSMGFNGWILGRTFFYFLMTMTNLWIYLRKCHPDSIGLSTLHESLFDLKDFIIDSLKLWIGNITKWVGYEIVTFFTIVRGERSQIAALGAILNVAYLFYAAGTGFLMIGRTRINYLLGAGYHKAAKKFSILVILCELVLSLVIGVVMYAKRASVAGYFASQDPEISTYLMRLIVNYIYFVPVDMCYTTILLICRSVDLLMFSTFALVGFTVLLNGALCWYLSIWLELDCTASFLCMCVCSSATLLLCFIRIMVYDWADVAIATSKRHPEVSKLLPLHERIDISAK